jgi:hypothetical protein
VSGGFWRSLQQEVADQFDRLGWPVRWDGCAGAEALIIPADRPATSAVTLSRAALGTSPGS